MSQEITHELVRRIDRLERLLGDLAAQETGGGGGAALPTTATAIYVAPHGSDANSGRTLAAPKLTIAAGLAAAAALAPASTQPVSVHVDAGVYAESVSVPSWVHVLAPAATLVGAITLAQSAQVVLARHYASASNQTMLTKTGTAVAYYTTIVSDGRGLAGALTGVVNLLNSTSSSIVFVDIQVVFVGAGGSGIRDTAPSVGHIHFHLKDLYLAGSNAAGIVAAGQSDIIGYVDHILRIGGPTGTTAISVGGNGVVRLTAGEIEANTAYSVAGGGSLWLQCPRVIGAQSGTLSGLLSSATPQPLGTAAAGTAGTAARGDHVHAMPTAAQVGALATSALSSATPQPLGAAAAGISGSVSRADHVHAMPTAAQVGVAQVRARVARSAVQSGVVPLTFTKLLWTTIVEDTTGMVDLSQSRITPPAGTYMLMIAMLWSSFSEDQCELIVSVFRNGTRHTDLPHAVSSGTGRTIGQGGALVITVDGSDYLEVFVRHTATTNQTVFGGPALVGTYWTLVRLA